MSSSGQVLDYHSLMLPIWILAWIQKRKQSNEDHIVKNIAFIFKWTKGWSSTWTCRPAQSLVYFKRLRDKNRLVVQRVAGRHLENHNFCCICHTELCLIITLESNSSFTAQHTCTKNIQFTFNDHKCKIKKLLKKSSNPYLCIFTSWFLAKTFLHFKAIALISQCAHKYIRWNF